MTKNYSGEFPNQGGLGNLHMQKALYRRQPYSALLHLLPGAQWSIIRNVIRKLAGFRHLKWNRLKNDSTCYDKIWSSPFFSCHLNHIWWFLENFGYFWWFRHKIGPLNFRMEFSVLDHCVYTGHCNRCGRPCHFWLQPGRCNIELV